MKHLIVILLLLLPLSAEERSDQKSFLLIKNEKSNDAAIRLGKKFLRDHKSSPKRTDVRMIMAVSYFNKGELKTSLKYFSTVVQRARSCDNGFKHDFAAMHYIALICEKLESDKVELYTSLSDFIATSTSTYLKNKTKLSLKSQKHWQALNATHKHLSKDPEVIKFIHTRKNRQPNQSHP